MSLEQMASIVKGAEIPVKPWKNLFEPFYKQRMVRVKGLDNPCVQMPYP